MTWTLTQNTATSNVTGPVLIGLPSGTVLFNGFLTGSVGRNNLSVHHHGQSRRRSKPAVVHGPAWRDDDRHGVQDGGPDVRHREQLYDSAAEHEPHADQAVGCALPDERACLPRYEPCSASGMRSKPMVWLLALLCRDLARRDRPRRQPRRLTAPTQLDVTGRWATDITHSNRPDAHDLDADAERDQRHRPPSSSAWRTASCSLNGSLTGTLTGSSLTYAIAVAQGGIPSQPTCTGQLGGTMTVTSGRCRRWSDR